MRQLLPAIAAGLTTRSELLGGIRGIKMARSRVEEGNMLGDFFVRRPSIVRWQAGPLGAHVAGFALELKTRRYAPKVIQEKIRIVGHLSLWIERRRISVSELSEARLDEYLRR